MKESGVERLKLAGAGAVLGALLVACGSSSTRAARDRVEFEAGAGGLPSPELGESRPLGTSGGAGLLGSAGLPAGAGGVESSSGGAAQAGDAGSPSGGTTASGGAGGNAGVGGAIACNASQFTCDNGQCVPLVYQCNSVSDCADGSDEASALCAVSGTGGDTAATGIRRVFLTVDEFPATFLGARAADAICQAEAGSRNLGGMWMAWISDSTTSPAERFNLNGGPFRLLGGTQIAADWADLTDGVLDSPIASSPWLVWTATKRDGTSSSGSSCLDWTDDHSVTTTGVGDASSTSALWTLDGGYAECSDQHHLYCFEQ